MKTLPILLALALPGFAQEAKQPTPSPTKNPAPQLADPFGDNPAEHKGGEADPFDEPQNFLSKTFDANQKEIPLPAPHGIGLPGHRSQTQCCLQE